jgi:hypothetical protein
MSLARFGLRAMVLGGLVALTMMALVAQSAVAEPATLCVKATKLTTPKRHYTGGWSDKGCTSVNATHEGKYEKLASFSASEEQQIKALLKYVNVQASGVAGKPTVRFSGANVQIVNGEGKTNTTNGAGNLVLGYDEAEACCDNANPPIQTGSHNLIIGEENEFTSFGGIVSGYDNFVKAPFASVTGGLANVAASSYATVVGGGGNNALAEYASVAGGTGNVAAGRGAWVGGGEGNQAEASVSSIFGGRSLKASKEWEALPSCVAPGNSGELC